jgi:hypothetical protein
MHLRTAATLIVASLGFIAMDATAQAGLDIGTPCARASRLESNVECPDARAGGAVVIEHEVALKPITVQGITFQTRQCRAEVELNYAQNNTLASVEGEIQNPTCGASSGSLVLSVRTANESGEQATQEFTQTWAREDDQAVKFSAEYPIGENVDLVRVRALRMTCTCAEIPQPDAAAPPE